MKINMKVRLRNKTFWLTMVPAAIAFIYATFGAIGIVPGVTESEVANIATAIITALAALGVLVDPTTNGISDSSQAMTYDEPKKEGE